MSITYHPIHKAHKCPERHGIILHNCVQWGKKIAHSLYVTQVGVIFIVRQEHVLHLLKMNIGAHIGEWGIWVRVRNVFSGKQRNRPICAMNILLCANVSNGLRKGEC